MAHGLRFMAGLLGGAVLLAACGDGERKAPDGSAVTVVRYGRWGTPEELGAENALMRQFEAANPDVRVELECTAWSEYWTKLQTSFAAGSGPDIFLIEGTRVHDYAERGQLLDLAPFARGKDGLDLGAYYPTTRDVYEFCGALWALPRDCNTIGIYYNKTLFDKYHVPYPEPGWTWEDFRAKAKALTRDDDGDGRADSYGFLAGFDTMELHWGSWVWQNGGEILDPTRTKCLVNQPAAVEALDFLVGLVQRDKVSPDTAQASTFGSTMFLTGRLGMSQDGSWMVGAYSRINSFEWAIAPLPKGKTFAAPVNGLGVSVYAKSKHPDAACRLAKFLASREYQEALAKSGTSIPAMKSVAEGPIYLDGKPESKKVFIDQIRTCGHALDFTRGYSQWEDALRRQLELVWLGRKPLQQAMEDAAREVEGILAGEKR